MRKCEKCGEQLSDEDVIKIKNDDGSYEIIPLSICPGCFKKRMIKVASEYASS